MDGSEPLKRGDGERKLKYFPWHIRGGHQEKFKLGPGSRVDHTGGFYYLHVCCVCVCAQCVCPVCVRVSVCAGGGGVNDSLAFSLEPGWI